ncbi:MAG: hypothetical protein JJU10_05395 [Idiomarina sp.]|nr:hypothetical protein [Idiomarina sp.]
MKTLRLIPALAGLMLAGTAVANVTAENSETATFELSGTIYEQCRVTVYCPDSRCQNLDLSSAAGSQTTASVGVWCNDGRGSANIQYESENGGLASGDNLIDYEMSVGNDSGLASSGVFEVNRPAGQGLQGAVQSRSFSIRPQTTGLETRGTYTDTVRVTVIVD